MCVQHSPEVIAAVAIHLACKWTDWEVFILTTGVIVTTDRS